MDYVERAEKVMKELGKPNSRDTSKLVFEITTTKIRGILALVNDIYNDEIVSTNEELSEKSKSKLLSLTVKMLYDAGKDDTGGIKRFIEKTSLLNEIKNIKGSRNEFIKVANYMEALVAYHRYLGGKDK